MKALFISQIAPAEKRLERGIPADTDTMPDIFAGLGVELTVVDATVEELPDPRLWDAIIVGGSLGSANDTEPWRLRLLDWLRDVPTDQPFFGICGGHQIFARANGGEVGPIGCVQAGVWPLHVECERCVIQAHAEGVVRVPAGAEVVAADQAGVQILRYSPTRVTTQFHPEFDAALAQLVFGLMEDVRAPEATDAAVAYGKEVLRAWIAAVRSGAGVAGVDAARVDDP